MSLAAQITEKLKDAMRAKDSLRLESLRAIKSALLLAQTESGAKEELTTDAEIKLLQRLVKQRKDSAAIYEQQNRADLAAPELAQAAIIEEFLPKQLSEAEVEAIVKGIVEAGNYSGMGSMSAVMSEASKALAGQADGKTISNVVKKILSA
jgi:uncharacterized protein YqeY